MLEIPPDLGPTPPPKGALDQIRAVFDGAVASVPAKRAGENLLIGTWNIAQLSRLTRKWATSPGDSPKRNLTDVCCLAQIISCFDVCAIQEVKRDLTALRTIMRILGDRWALIVSDVTEGDPGNTERLAYVYDRTRLRPSGLVGEIVIPTEQLGIIGDGLDRQFARTPYAVSFATDTKAFTLVTLHVLYGDTKAETERRIRELGAVAEWLADRAEDPDEFNRNLIALGDFNIDRFGDPAWEAFVSRGLGPPIELQDVPRTITAASGATNKFYDQVAWFSDGNKRRLTLKYQTAGYVRWTDFLLQNAPNDADRKAHISDHYPLWAEFAIT